MPGVTRFQAHRPPATPSREADEQRNEGNGRGLPGDHRGHLTADEPEGLQDGQVPAALAHRGDEGVAHGRHAEDHDEAREQRWEAIDTLEVEDVFGRQLPEHGPSEVAPQTGVGRRLRHARRVTYGEKREYRWGN